MHPPKKSVKPILIRLDGLYGTVAVLLKLLFSGLGVIVRCKDYGLLDLPEVAARLQLPPDQSTIHAESGTSRALFDCPDIALLPSGPRVRLIVATHPSTSPNKPPIGIVRDETVYELFLPTAPQTAFTCTDMLDLSLHRGSFETILADEDKEQETDRWCSRTACGQEFWQIISQWIWNLRLDLGQQLSPAPMGLTEFAPAQIADVGASCEPGQPSAPASRSESAVYGPPQWARRSFTKGFAGSAFAPQPDGTLQCPAGHPLTVQERRPERNGSLRIVYGARIRHCRPCPLREQCQEAPTTQKPRQVSAVFWPLASSLSVPTQSLSEPLPPPPTPHPVLWGDWPRCQLRRNFMRVLHTQTVQITFRSPQLEQDQPVSSDEVQSRAQRAHWRLNWQQRIVRNARQAQASPLEITIYGLPAALAQYVSCGQVPAA